MKIATSTSAGLATALALALAAQPVQAGNVLSTLGSAAARAASHAGQDGAGGDLIDATDPERLAALMRDEGYKAAIETDSDGAPLIRSQASGANFRVQFYDCDDAKANCRSLTFQAGFDLDHEMPLEEANAWNREMRFGKAWIDDEGDPFLEMSITLDGGVTEANFADSLDWWAVALGQFAQKIDW